jgi:hypothetical protein
MWSVTARTSRLTRGPVRARLPQAGFSSFQGQAEEHVAQALLDEAPVGRLSRDRNPSLLARSGDVETGIDESTKAGRDVGVSLAFVVLVYLAWR